MAGAVIAMSKHHVFIDPFTSNNDHLANPLWPYGLLLLIYPALDSVYAADCHIMAIIAVILVIGHPP